MEGEPARCRMEPLEALRRPLSSASASIHNPTDGPFWQAAVPSKADVRAGADSYRKAHQSLMLVDRSFDLAHR